MKTHDKMVICQSPTLPWTCCGTTALQMPSWWSCKCCYTHHRDHHQPIWVIGVPQMSWQSFSIPVYPHPLSGNCWRSSLPTVCLDACPTSFATCFFFMIPPGIVPRKIVLARPDDPVMCPYHLTFFLDRPHLSFSFSAFWTVTIVSRSSKRCIHTLHWVIFHSYNALV